MMYDRAAHRARVHLPGMWDSGATPADESPMPAASPVPRGIVYLIDDDPAVRRAMTRLLRAASFRVSSFAAGEEFLMSAAMDDRPACLVADLSMPGMSGLELQQLIRRLELPLPIIFISGRADLGSGVEAMRNGAVDFLQKPVLIQHLLPVVDRAMDRDREQRARAADRKVLSLRAERLTPREREVFALVVSGLANKCVAAELGASEKTIKVHRARVMEKMEASSFAELVRIADKLGVGPHPPASLSASER